LLFLSYDLCPLSIFFPSLVFFIGPITPKKLRWAKITRHTTDAQINLRPVFPHPGSTIVFGNLETTATTNSIRKVDRVTSRVACTIPNPNAILENGDLIRFLSSRIMDTPSHNGFKDSSSLLGQNKGIVDNIPRPDNVFLSSPAMHTLPLCVTNTSHTQSGTGVASIGVHDNAALLTISYGCEALLEDFLLL
jgi:hypothetical protein